MILHILTSSKHQLPTEHMHDVITTSLWRNVFAGLLYWKIAIDNTGAWKILIPSFGNQWVKSITSVMGILSYAIWQHEIAIEMQDIAYYRNYLGLCKQNVRRHGVITRRMLLIREPGCGIRSFLCHKTVWLWYYEPASIYETKWLVSFRDAADPGRYGSNFESHTKIK